MEIRRNIITTEIVDAVGRIVATNGSARSFDEEGFTSRSSRFYAKPWPNVRTKDTLLTADPLFILHAETAGPVDVGTVWNGLAPLLGKMSAKDATELAKKIADNVYARFGGSETPIDSPSFNAITGTIDANKAFLNRAALAERRECEKKGNEMKARIEEFNRKQWGAIE